MNNKILIIGDSLALPGHLNKYEDTWVYKLKSLYLNYDFITFLQRQLTTDVLVTMGGGEKGIDKYSKGADCLEFYSPKYIILQLGIVDCAPRLLFKYERIILSKLNVSFRNIYLRFLKRIRKRNANNTFVPYNRFKKNLNNYLSRCKKNNIQKIIIIEIPYPSDMLINNNPTIVKNIKLYNSIIRNFKKTYNNLFFISPLNSQKYSRNIFEDGYHPNKLGHEIIYRELIKILNNYCDI